MGVIEAFACNVYCEFCETMESSSKSKVSCLLSSCHLLVACQVTNFTMFLVVIGAALTLLHSQILVVRIAFGSISQQCLHGCLTLMHLSVASDAVFCSTP